MSIIRFELMEKNEHTSWMYQKKQYLDVTSVDKLAVDVAIYDAVCDFNKEVNGTNDLTLEKFIEETYWSCGAVYSCDEELCIYINDEFYYLNNCYVTVNNKIILTATKVSDEENSDEELEVYYFLAVY